MINTSIIDIKENNVIKRINFKHEEFPQPGDNLIINDITYVVQRKSYIIDSEEYHVALLVKEFIPNRFGY